MRKVLSFVLILALVLGSFSMAFAATPAGGFSDTDAEAVSVLADLDVIDGYPDGTFKPGNVVTRAEMAKLIIVALGLEKFATSTTSKYSDMAGAGWAQGYVAYATSLGIIEGYPDGTFGPSNPVTYNEACAMIVRALGYTADFLPGGWPAEWVVKAQTLGILDGVNAGGATGATRGNIAEMLYNALELEIGYVNKDGDWVANTPKDTMLVRLGAEFIAAEDAENGGIILGDEDTAINLRPFVGAYADRYINDDDEIIKVVPVSEFLTGDFVNDGDGCGGTFTTTDDVEYNIASAVADPTTPFAVGFYNGVAEWDNDYLCDWTYYDGEDYVTDQITIAVDKSGKTIKKIYSIAEWDTDIAFQFDSDYADEIADDQSLAGEDFMLDDNDDIDLNSFELLGADSLDKIKKDSVVYVYVDDVDNFIRKIEVGTATVTGKVTLIDGDDYTIGGKVYTVADYAFDVADLDLGNSGTAYLDYNGEIAVFDIEDAQADNYAIVTDTLIQSGRDQMIELLTKDGTTTDFVVTADVLDGTTYDYEDDATTVGALEIGDLVTYGLNKSGKIDEMTELEQTAASLDAQLSSTRKVFDDVLVDSGVVVFTADGGDYDVTDLASLDTGSDMPDSTYYTKDGKIKVMIVNIDYIGAADVYAVFNKVNTAYNDDDDKVQLVQGFSAGKAYSAYTDDTGVVGSDATEDYVNIWKLTTNADGVITKAITTTGEKTVVAGEVTKKDSSTLISVDGVWCTIDPSAVVYQFDYTEANEYSVKSLTSIKAETAYADGSYVELYQLDDDSEVYDLVVIHKNMPMPI